MLVLTRKKGESIVISEHIEITVLGVEGETIRIGVSAPKDVEIYRKEIYLTIQKSNEEASSAPDDLLRMMTNWKSKK